MVAALSPPITSHHGGISTVHPDILHSHILTRLDGPTLAAASCASSELHALSTNDQLWRNICASTWPSVDDPLVNQVISTFPSGHRSFFSDSFPLITHYHHRSHNHNLGRPTTTELISAVDIFYQNSPILSKVVETETVTGWFLCSPFRVDLLEPKEYVRTRVRQTGEMRVWLKELEENLSLSWILIDPKRKRAMNVSSMRAVSVERHWLTGEVQAKFAAVMGGGGGKGSETEYVKCEIAVTCGGKEGGEVHVREVSMGMEDMEGRNLSGKDSLVILQGAMERGERRRKSGKEGKERFEEYLERKMERKERLQRREKALDMACMLTGVTIFLSFWCFFLFR